MTEKTKERELLELLAESAGIRLEWDYSPDQWQAMYYEGKTYHAWDPAEVEKDALRLATRLRAGGKADPKWNSLLDAAIHAGSLPKVDGKENIDEGMRRDIVQAAVETQLAGS